MQRRNEIIAGEVGHTKIKREYGMFSLYKLHKGEIRYRKIMESTDYEVLRPHRHEHRKKYTYTPPAPITVEQSREWQRKHYNSQCSGEPDKNRARQGKAFVYNPLPLPKKVVQTMDTTLRAKDKALERIAKPEKLVIKDNDRPYKEVVIDSKTTIRVHPDRVEGAKERYYRWLHKSQEQANTKQRSGNIKPAAKVKQPQSDLIFFH